MPVVAHASLRTVQWSGPRTTVSQFAVRYILVSTAVDYGYPSNSPSNSMIDLPELDLMLKAHG